MSYNPSWSNANAQGLLIGGQHSPILADISELADAVNRRRLMMYYASQDFSSALAPNSYVRNLALATAVAPPFHNFRSNIVFVLLNSTSPHNRRWLWPLADADENKIILPCSAPAPDGCVSLFDKLNGSSLWTDVFLTAGVTPVRAVHVNELRQAIGLLNRGSWMLVADAAGGIYSYLPDAHWGGALIANDGEDELRAIYYTTIKTATQGLSNVTARPSSCLKLTADYDCQLQVYACLRNIDVVNGPATWNNWSTGNPWASPGGLGSGDSTLVGSLTLEANQEGIISGEPLAAALNGMIQGNPQLFIIRRSDVEWQTIEIPAFNMVVDFDLDTPPN